MSLTRWIYEAIKFTMTIKSLYIITIEFSKIVLP